MEFLLRKIRSEKNAKFDTKDAHNNEKLGKLRNQSSKMAQKYIDKIE